ncbi:MAG: DUF6702 family protein [Bacteroidales bacterium]|nr:DUF6702 family protein [Bacteroidales bacterium]
MFKFLLIYIFSFFFHPVHVSMSSMEYIPGDRGYKITVRMYSDDLLLDLVNMYEIPEEHIDDHIYCGPDNVYQDYINDRLRFMLDSQQYKARLIDAEKLEIETVMHLFIECHDEIDTIDIHNTILKGIYPDQVNLFIYKDDINEKALRFTAVYSRETLELKAAD